MGAKVLFKVFPVKEWHWVKTCSQECGKDVIQNTEVQHRLRADKVWIFSPYLSKDILCLWQKAMFWTVTIYLFPRVSRLLYKADHENSQPPQWYKPSMITYAPSSLLLCHLFIYIKSIYLIYHLLIISILYKSIAYILSIFYLYSTYESAIYILTHSVSSLAFNLFY